jgi:hypothetical protein
VSRVSEIRDVLEMKLAMELPGYTKLSDAFDSVDNANQLLEKGFAIAYGPAEGVYDEWCMGQMRQRREFRIVLTNIYLAGTDANYRTARETDLMEDEFTIIGSITRDVTLTGVAINSEFGFDQGIQYLEADQKQYIIMVMSFVIDYIEEV